MVTTAGLVRFLVSNRLTLVLLLAFAGSMGYATFLENDFGTPAARAVIYEAWWFELLMMLLGVNFVGNIFRYRLYRKEKWSILLFHLAFVVILAGAFITRYSSLEGLIRIREGSASDVIISQKHYLQLEIEDGSKIHYFEKPLRVSSLTPPDFQERVELNGRSLEIRSLEFIPDAEKSLAPGDQDAVVIEVATATDEGRIDHLLERNKRIVRDQLVIAFDQPVTEGISIEKVKDQYYLRSSMPLEFMVMANQQMGTVSPDTLTELKQRTLYQSPKGSFVVGSIAEEKKVVYQSTTDREAAKTLPDLLKVEVNSGGEISQLTLFAREGLISPFESVKIGTLNLSINYGPKPIHLPFSIHLNDFQLKRYPGSTSPSSYASEITVFDEAQSFPYRIFMNNVLDYKGYRFFQASYDLDELGTVLSVNRDWWGTYITYLGYFFMGLGMMLALFGKNTRFQHINRRLKQLKVPVVACLLMLMATMAEAADKTKEIDRDQQQAGTIDLKTLIPAQFVDADHAAAFGRLLVQDLDGRIKPLNTLASEFLRKVMRKLEFEFEQAEGKMVMDSDQVFLSLHADPVAWQFIPLIKVDPKKGAQIFELLDKPPRSYLAFQDFLEENGDYKLSKWVQESNRKKPAERNSLDQEVLKVDERFNIVFQALNGQYLKIFPQPNDPLHTWYSSQFIQAGFSTEDSLFVKQIIPRYFHSVQQARLAADWTDPQENLAYIKTFQEVLGKEVSPSPRRVEAELVYNKLNLFYWLFPYFWIVGVFMLVVVLMQVFLGPGKWTDVAIKFATALGFVGFLVLTFNMILRWYAGDHAPWSNGYEMTILVTWSIFLFAFLFIRKSAFIIPLACLFGGTLLFVSFLDWLNPEITNLVPVLKSYWLKIHVAIIVSSYAPLALSALLGFTSLWMIISKRFKQTPRLEQSIEEMTYLNEMSMTIGLFLLAIGTFLGGVWANESWGRYWGWDPKETWALISVIVYAAVLHMRLVPGLRSAYSFNLASVVAFSSIVMTSFGVNYYLAGLHSYAKGDPLPVPSFIYWTSAVVFITALMAYFSLRNNHIQYNIKSE